MKPTVLTGVVLIVVAVVALVYQSFSYTTQKEVLNLGPLQVRAEENRTVRLPPLLSALVLAGGIALVLAGSRRV